MLQQLVLGSGGTRHVRFSKALFIAAGLAGLIAALSAFVAPRGGFWLQLTLLHDFVRQLLAAGYQKQPALVLVLSALLVVPLLAMLALAVQILMRWLAWYRRPMPIRRDSEDWTRDSRPRPGIPAWPAHAWLQIAGEGRPIALASDVVSLGRHEDNVVHIDDDTVHRFHAVIHRDDDAHFIITDLSGDAGNGIRVNGTRLSQAHLADGDHIELGRRSITFAAQPH